MAERTRTYTAPYWVLRIMTLLLVAFHGYAFLTGAAVDALGGDDEPGVGGFAWGAAIGVVALYVLFRVFGPRHLDTTALLGLVLGVDVIALILYEPLGEVWGLIALAVVFVAATGYFEVQRHAALGGAGAVEAEPEA